MSFVKIEQELFLGRKTAVQKLDEYLQTLSDDNREAAIRILTHASQKKAMDAFREEGFPISYVTLCNWRKAHHGV
jgi:hypothetical protein